MSILRVLDMIINQTFHCICIYMYANIFFVHDGQKFNLSHLNPVWSVLWSSRSSLYQKTGKFFRKRVLFFFSKSFPIPCCKSTNCQLSSQSSQNKLDTEWSVCIQKWRWESFRFPSQIKYYKYLHNLISVTRKYC